jgi:hypothetical protein
MEVFLSTANILTLKLTSSILKVIEEIFYGKTLFERAIEN